MQVWQNGAAAAQQDVIEGRIERCISAGQHLLRCTRSVTNRLAGMCSMTDEGSSADRKNSSTVDAPSRCLTCMARQGTHLKGTGAVCTVQHHHAAVHDLTLQVTNSGAPCQPNSCWLLRCRLLLRSSPAVAAQAPSRSSAKSEG